MLDLSGKRFGYLTAQWPAGYKGKDRKIMWLSVCDCGGLAVTRAKHLTRGAVVSCGCYKASRARRLQVRHGHGNNRNKTWKTWFGMRQRCEYRKHVSYKYYGARGIVVCERWQSFENFLADMGEKPEGLSIDRINNDGNYEPGNCRWATRSEQQRNKRSYQRTLK